MRIKQTLLHEIGQQLIPIHGRDLRNRAPNCNTSTFKYAIETRAGRIPEGFAMADWFLKGVKATYVKVGKRINITHVHNCF